MTAHYDSEVRSVAKFSNGNILVSTYYGDNVFQTCIKHPSYKKDEMILAQEYQTRDDAQAGHKYWIGCVLSNNMPPLIGMKTVEPSDKKSSGNEQSLCKQRIRISFGSLIKILSKITSSDNKVMVLVPDGDKNRILLTMATKDGSSILYNMNTMETEFCGTNWREIIKQAKELIKIEESIKHAAAFQI